MTDTIVLNCDNMSLQVNKLYSVVRYLCVGYHLSKLKTCQKTCGDRQCLKSSLNFIPEKNSKQLDWKVRKRVYLKTFLVSNQPVFLLYSRPTDKEEIPPILATQFPLMFALRLSFKKTQWLIVLLATSLAVWLSSVSQSHYLLRSK